MACATFRYSQASSVDIWPLPPHSHALALALRHIVTFLPLRAPVLPFLKISSVVSPIHFYLHTVVSTFGSLIHFNMGIHPVTEDISPHPSSSREACTSPSWPTHFHESVYASCPRVILTPIKPVKPQSGLHTRYPFKPVLLSTMCLRS